MRVAVKATLPTGYWTLGRHWPRHPQIEVDLTTEEYAQIVDDMNLVSVVIPDVVAESATPQTNHNYKIKGK